MGCPSADRKLGDRSLEGCAAHNKFSSEFCHGWRPGKKQFLRSPGRSNPNLDFSGRRLKHPRPFGKAQAKLAAIVVPAHVHPHVLAALIVETDAIIFVKGGFTVHTWVDRNAQRIVRLSIRVLLDVPTRHKSSGSNKKRQRGEIDWAC